MAIATIDAYLAGIAEPARAALEQLRQMIRAAAPDAKEAISYGVPCFKQDGVLVSFGAAKAHCAFYVMSPGVMAAMGEALAGFDTSKGTIRFTPEEPLAAALVTRIVKARLEENRRLRKKD